MKLLVLVLTVCSFTAGKAAPTGDDSPSPRIINNAGSSNHNNDVKNGNDDVKGNLVNGNGNGDNSHSGNVPRSRGCTECSIDPFIINNSGNSNSHNTVSNEDDTVNGNLVNGNQNGDNTESGNVATFIINNSGNSNSNNSVSNGNDDVSGNIVNGNSNGDNSNSGNVGASSTARPEQDGKQTVSQISDLLRLISRQVDIIKKIPNGATSPLLSKLTAARAIVQNVIVDLNNTPAVLVDGKLKSLVEHLGSQINVIVITVVRKLDNPVAGVIPALGLGSIASIVNSNSDQLTLVPSLLQEVARILSSLY